MLVSYARSSSLNQFEFCQHSYALTYLLGLRPGANQKAAMGTLTHKALELLGYWKLATQNGESTFTDGETGVILSRQGMAVDKAIEVAWNYYTKPIREESQWGLAGKPLAYGEPYEWTDTHRQTITGWVYDLLRYNDGMFSPLKRDVLTPEQYFSFTLDRPWANYIYKSDTGEEHRGTWSLKGSIDLVTKIDNDTLELIDFKTGQRRDFNKGTTKDYAALTRDVQLHCYYLALKHLYPQYKTIIVTVFFIRDGGAYTLCYDENHERYAELMLRRRFEAIQATQKPKILNPSQNKNDWLKCNKFCHFGKTKFLDETTGLLTDQTICAKMHEEIVTLGVDRVQAKWGKPGANNTYQGGGKTIETA